MSDFFNCGPNEIPEVDYIGNLQDKRTFEYLYNYYDGDSEAAYRKFKEIQDNKRNKYLKDSIATKVMEEFTPEQQRSIVKTVKFIFYKSLSRDSIKDDGGPVVNLIERQIRGYFEKRLRKKFQDNEYKLAKVNEILENWDELWRMSQNELKSAGVEFTDDGHVVSTEGVDATRRNWDDNAILKINPKDTASTRVKAVLSMIKKVEYDRDQDNKIKTGEDNLPKKKLSENFLGMKEYVDMDNIYNKVSGVLSDFVTPKDTENRYQAYIDHLRELGRTNPQMLQVVEKLESMQDSESFKADFVNTFGKTYTKQSMILLSPVYGKSGQLGYNLNVIDSNRTSQVQTIKNQWYENQKQLSIVKRDDEQDLVINQSEVESIRDDYISKMSKHLNTGGEVTDGRAIEIVRDTLAKLGISLRPESLVYASQNPQTAISETGSDWYYHVAPDNLKRGRGLMKNVFDAFLNTRDPSFDDVDEYGKLGVNNPVKGRDSQGMIKKLAKVEAEHTPKVFSPSLNNVKGNNIHAINDHSSLSREVGRLEANPNEATSDRGVYDSQSIILQSIENDNASIRDVFEIEWTDGLRRMNRSQGSEYPGMSTSEKEVLRLSLFQNQQKNGRVKMLAPTLSDKTREYIVTLPKITSLFGIDQWIPSDEPNMISEDGEFQYKMGNDITRGIHPSGKIGLALLKMAEGEIERIKNIQSQLENMKPEDHPYGEDYMREGQFFYHFPELNPGQLNEEEVGNLWRQTTVNEETIYKLKDTDSARQFIRQKLVESIQEDVERTKNRWESQEIVQDRGNYKTWLMDRTYLKDEVPYNLSDSERALTYAALDYQMSQRFFHTDITKILAGDPALHVDSQRDEDQGNLFEDPATINATLVNLTKRLANHIAPALTQNIGKNQNNENLEDTTRVRIATVEDRIIESQHIDQYRELFKNQLGNESLAEAYEAIESTDAQEYTTLREFVRTKLLNGEISKEVYDKVVNRIDEVQANGDPNNYFKLSNIDGLSKEEIENLLMIPHKDVYVGRKYYPHLDSTNWIYRKTSAIPLIPEVTQGTSLDNLRLAMEEKGVDRVAYTSADKTGAYNPTNPFDESTEGKPFKSKQDIIDQFVTPEDADNPDKPNVGKNDLTVQDVNRDDLGLQFQIPTKDDRKITTVSQMNKMLTQGIKGSDGFIVPWKDDPVDGKTLEQMKQDRMKEIYEIGREKLLDEFDAEIVENEDGRRVIRFNDIEAVQEAVQKEAEKRDWSPAAIDSIQIEDDQFILPFSFSPASTQIESLLLSIVEDRTVGQKMPGKSFVQVSTAGWDGISSRSSVYTTKSFDPEDGGLQHLRIDEETGEVKPAQILINWNFKDENGNTLPIEDYLDDDGNIDDNKLDPRLRELISARIPNQGPNSMLPTEVVGFLPPTMEKTMVVTEEIVAQMGSDFDVDKIFSYMDEYAIEDDGSLRRAGINDDGFSRQDKLKQEYKNIHWSALMNKDTIARVLKPLDMDYLENEAKAISNIKNPGKEIFDWADPHYQIDNHNSQHIGRALIGITSLASNFNSMLEMYPQEMVGMDSEGNQKKRVVRAKSEDQNIDLDQVGGYGTTVTMPDGQGGTIADIIMMYQNGAVDNAKKLILDKLNATTNTAEVIMTLAMLNDGGQGIPLKQLTRFFAQESIGRLDEQIDKLQGQTNDEYFEDDVEQVAARRVKKEIINNFDQNDREWIKEQVKRNTNQGDRIVDVEIPTEQQLTHDLEKFGENQTRVATDRQYAANQIKYLQEFMRLKNNISDELVSIRSTVNFGDRNGPGKSLLHSKNKLDNYENLSDNNVFPNATDIVDNNEWEAAAENTFKLAWELYHPADRELFHYDTPIFNGVKGELEDISGDQIDSDKALKIFKDMKGFFFSSGNIYKEGDENAEDVKVDGERSKLLFGTNNIEDIATRVKNAQDGWGRNSFLLNRIQTRIPEKDGQPGTILFKADKAENTDDIKLIQEFASMLTSMDPRQRLLAEDMVKYAYLVEGGVQTPTTFINYIPIQYLVEELNLRDTINNFDFQNNIGDQQKRFKTQYFQHNPSDAKVINEDVVDNLRVNGRLPTKIDTYSNDNFYRNVGRGDKQPIKFVSLYDQSDNKWRVYQYHSGTQDHYEIDTLGKANEDGFNTVEYNISEDKRINSSLIESNQTRKDEDPFDEAGNPETISERSMDRVLEEESEIDYQTFFDSVMDNTDDPYVKKVMKFLDDVIENKENINIKTAPQNAGVFSSNTTDATYKRSSGNIWLSEGILQRSYSSNEIARATLHEFAHKLTADIINSDNRTKKQDEIVGNLKKLMRTAVDKNKPTGKVKNLLKPSGERKDDIVYEYDSDNNLKVDLNEFVASMFANEVTQKWASNIQVGDESLLDKFIQNIIDLVNDIGESLGLGSIDKRSTLAYSLNDIMRLMDQDQVRDRSVADNSKSKDKSEAKESDDDSSEPGSFSEMQDKAMNQDSLGQSVGEFRNSLSDRQREVFDQIKNRIKTTC